MVYFKAVQLFTHNVQAPEPPSNRFETTSEGGLNATCTRGYKGKRIVTRGNGKKEKREEEREKVGEKEEGGEGKGEKRKWGGERRAKEGGEGRRE